MTWQVASPRANDSNPALRSHFWLFLQYPIGYIGHPYSGLGELYETINTTGNNHWGHLGDEQPKMVISTVEKS